MFGLVVSNVCICVCSSVFIVLLVSVMFCLFSDFFRCWYCCISWCIVILLVGWNSDNVWFVGGVLRRFSWVSFCCICCIGVSSNVRCVLVLNVNLLMFFGNMVSVILDVNGILWY